MSQIERVTKGLVRETDTHGNTLMHVCAQWGNLDLLKVLFNRDDMMIDARNTRKNTCLHCAVSNGHQAVVRALLRQGAEVDAQNIDGNAGIHMATINKSVDIANSLIKG